jgi:hypothetical protein
MLRPDAFALAAVLGASCSALYARPPTSAERAAGTDGSCTVVVAPVLDTLVAVGLYALAIHASGKKDCNLLDAGCESTQMLVAPSVAVGTLYAASGIYGLWVDSRCRTAAK